MHQLGLSYIRNNIFVSKYKDIYSGGGGPITGGCFNVGFSGILQIVKS